MNLTALRAEALSPLRGSIVFLDIEPWADADACPGLNAGAAARLKNMMFVPTRERQDFSDRIPGQSLGVFDKAVRSQFASAKQHDLVEDSKIVAPNTRQLV